jgi:hypothetical protein
MRGSTVHFQMLMPLQDTQSNEFQFFFFFNNTKRKTKQAIGPVLFSIHNLI